MWGGKQIAKLGGEGAAALSTGSTADIYYIAVPFRCKPIRSCFTVTTASTGTSAVIDFDSITYTATGSSTRGVGDVGSITVPYDTDYAYKCYYDVTDYVAAGTGTWKGSLNEGDLIIVEVSTASTGGAGFPFVIVEVDPEQPANNSNMIKSA